MDEEDVVVIEDRAPAGGLRLGGVPAPPQDLAARVLLLLVVERVEPLEVNEGVEHLRPLVEGAARALHHLWVGVGAEQEQVTVLLSPDGVRRRPVAVDVEVLVVETSRGVVPLCDLDRARLVADIDQVQPVRPAVRVIVVWYGIELRVGQLVVDQDPVVVLGRLDVDDPRDLRVVGGEKPDLVRLADVEDLKLVVGGDVGEAAARPVPVDLAVLEEVPLDGYLRVVPGRGPDVLVLVEAGTACHVVQVGRRLDLAIAVQVVVVDHLGIGRLQPVCHQIAVRVVLVLYLHDRVDPLPIIGIRVVIVTPEAARGHR